MCSRDAGVQPVLLAGNHDPDEKAGLEIAGRPHLRFARPCAVQGGGSVGMGIFEKQAGFRELIAAFPEAEADLLRRLELARAMSAGASCFHTRSGTHQNKLVRFLAHSSALAAGTARADSSGMADDDAAHGEICRPFFPEAEVVIFGHLHRRAVSGKRGRRLYVNLRACFRHAR